MKNKKILKQFIVFLKENNAYNDYLINLKYDTYYRKTNAFIREQNEIMWLINTIKRCPARLILDAFSWSYEVNNINWDELDSKWRDNLKKFKK